MSFVPDIIVVTSDEPWSKTWHTQLLYSDYLSKKFKVIYIDPPSRWRPAHLFRTRTRERWINDNLELFSYVNIFPSFLKLFREFNELRNQRLILGKLNAYHSKNVLIWHFDSYRSAFDKEFFKKQFTLRRVYHVIDPYMKNRLNAYLSEQADVLVVTSPRNVVYYQNYRNKLLNIPQCIDLEKTGRLLTHTGDKNIAGGNDFLVLLGTISNDIEFDWIYKLLKRQSLHIVMIGRLTSNVRSHSGLKRLTKMKSFHLFSEMTPEEFYPIIKRAKAGLILYNEWRRGRAFSPLKAVNYIAAGIPVITNSDCEIEELNGECIYMIRNTEELILNVGEAAHNRLKFNREAAENYLQKISLKTAIDNILSRL